MCYSYRQVVGSKAILLVIPFAANDEDLDLNDLLALIQDPDDLFAINEDLDDLFAIHEENENEELEEGIDEDDLFEIDLGIDFDIAFPPPLTETASGQSSMEHGESSHVKDDPPPLEKSTDEDFVPSVAEHVPPTGYGQLQLVSYGVVMAVLIMAVYWYHRENI